MCSWLHLPSWPVLLLGPVNPETALIVIHKKPKRWAHMMVQIGLEISVVPVWWSVRFANNWLFFQTPNGIVLLSLKFSKSDLLLSVTCTSSATSLGSSFFAYFASWQYLQRAEESSSGLSWSPSHLHPLEKLLVLKPEIGVWQTDWESGCELSITVFQETCTHFPKALHLKPIRSCYFQFFSQEFGWVFNRMA